MPGGMLELDTASLFGGIFELDWDVGLTCDLFCASTGDSSSSSSVDMYGMTTGTSASLQTLPSLVHEGPFDFSAFSYAQPPLAQQVSQSFSYACPSTFRLIMLYYFLFHLVFCLISLITYVVSS